jgi:DNA primase large subunit
MELTEDEAYSIAYSHCKEIPTAIYTKFPSKIGSVYISKGLIAEVGLENGYMTYTQEELLKIIKEPYREKIGVAIAEMLMAAL